MDAWQEEELIELSERIESLEAQAQEITRKSRSTSDASVAAHGHPQHFDEAAVSGMRESASGSTGSTAVAKRTVDESKGEKAGALRIEKNGTWTEKWFVVQDSMLRCA